MRQREVNLTRLYYWKILNEDDPLFKDLFLQNEDRGGEALSKKV